MKFKEFDSRGRTLKYFIKGDVSAVFSGWLFNALSLFAFGYIISHDFEKAICVSMLSFIAVPIALFLILVIRIIDIKSMSKYLD